MSNSMEGMNMDKKMDAGQPDPIDESLKKIAEIRAKAKERDPNFMDDVNREIVERQSAKLASWPVPAEKKPVRKIPPGARAHHTFMEKTLNENDK